MAAVPDSASQSRQFYEQIWLEDALRKLYKKLDSLEAKPRSHRKRKLNVPTLKIGDLKRTENGDLEYEDTETITSGLTKNNDEKFWSFVDQFFEYKPFHPESKEGFFESVQIPPIPKYKHLIIDENGVLRTEEKEESALEEKVFSKIQKIRTKKATDAISKEVFEERALKKFKHR